MLLAIVVSIVFGIWAGRAAKGMNVGEIGVAMGVAIVCAVISFFLGLVAHAIIGSMFLGAVFGAASFGVTKKLSS